jgi:hypothetical protein
VFGSGELGVRSGDEMAPRDRGLIKVSGLTIAEIAALLGRKRQAIYAGIANERRYFSTAEIALIVQRTWADDSEHYEQLLNFVRTEYAPPSPDEFDERNYIVPARIGYQRMTRVLMKSDQIIVVANDRLEHFGRRAPFAGALREILRNYQPYMDLVVPANWVAAYIQEQMKLTMPQRLHILDIDVLPMVLARNTGAIRSFIRGFVFAERLLEISREDAAKAWQTLQDKGVEYRLPDVLA